MVTGILKNKGKTKRFAFTSKIGSSQSHVDVCHPSLDIQALKILFRVKIPVKGICLNSKTKFAIAIKTSPFTRVSASKSLSLFLPSLISDVDRTME